MEKYLIGYNNDFQKKIMFVYEIYDNGKELKINENIEKAIIFDDIEKIFQAIMRLNLDGLKILTMEQALLLYVKNQNNYIEASNYFNEIHNLKNWKI